ncbi:MAG: oligoendopeptidase F [Erysipelotrichaceae bacterium]|nr:oligoendopeptidase F [Erysipelotrichaceae bacterium]
MKWDLSYFYANDEQFLTDLNEIEKLSNKIETFKGRLHEEDIFVEALLFSDELDDKLCKVFQYAHLKSDLNKKDVVAASNLQKVYIIFNKINQLASFQSPEILSLGKEKVMSFIDNHKEISQHRFEMEKLFHSVEHVLDASKEQLLSYYSTINNTSSDLYDDLATSDRNYQSVKLSDGKKVLVTQGNWTSLIADAKNAKDRKKIFEAIFSYYEKNKTTFAEIYQMSYKLDKANVNARNFSSILQSYLFRNNIPTSVYETLVEVASTQNKSLKKYIKLRKKYLNLKSYHTYDRFIQLAHSNKKYSFDEAKELFYASISSFPQDFQDKAHEALRDGFVDVYETEGKRTGAYSSSQPDLHPFILLNYTDTLDDVFTLAHEAGHSMHSLYAQEAQSKNLQGYTIFVAEIASTFNEHNLLDYLMSSSTLSKDEKIMLLQKQIDEIMSTFYRQTLFAHYELEVSRLVENNQVIDHTILSNIMIKLYKQYYGLDISKEKVKQYVWAYIPHLFHTPFYVYQYATSFAASFALYENIKNNKENAFEKYTNLLKSGGSKYPIDQTMEAGIDLTCKDTFMAVVHRMDELVEKLESLLMGE